MHATLISLEEGEDKNVISYGVLFSRDLMLIHLMETVGQSAGSDLIVQSYAWLLKSLIYSSETYSQVSLCRIVSHVGQCPSFSFTYSWYFE